MTTERIDVLAVMESAAKWRGDFMDDYVSAAELREARAAVAELIEAAEPFDDYEGYETWSGAAIIELVVTVDDLRRLHATIQRVQGK